MYMMINYYDRHKATRLNGVLFGSERYNADTRSYDIEEYIASYNVMRSVTILICI